MCKMSEEWERKRTYLLRSMLEELPNISTIRECEEEEEGSGEDEEESLPELTLEIVKKENRHDHPDEFYERLEKKMKRLYRKYFLNSKDSSSFLEFSGCFAEEGRIDDNDLSCHELEAPTIDENDDNDLSRHELDAITIAGIDDNDLSSHEVLVGDDKKDTDDEEVTDITIDNQMSTGRVSPETEMGSESLAKSTEASIADDAPSCPTDSSIKAPDSASPQAISEDDERLRDEADAVSRYASSSNTSSLVLGKRLLEEKVNGKGPVDESLLRYLSHSNISNKSPSIIGRRNSSTNDYVTFRKKRRISDIRVDITPSVPTTMCESIDDVREHLVPEHTGSGDDQKLSKDTKVLSPSSSTSAETSLILGSRPVVAKMGRMGPLRSHLASLRCSISGQSIKSPETMRKRKSTAEFITSRRSINISDIQDDFTPPVKTAILEITNDIIEDAVPPHTLFEGEGVAASTPIAGSPSFVDRRLVDDDMENSGGGESLVLHSSSSSLDSVDKRDVALQTSFSDDSTDLETIWANAFIGTPVVFNF